MANNNRDTTVSEVTRTDTANVGINEEMHIRETQITDQLIVTQTVLKKLGLGANIYGKNIRDFNIRIGNLGTPLAPDPRGPQSGFKPRGDPKKDRCILPNTQKSVPTQKQ